MASGVPFSDIEVTGADLEQAFVALTSDLADARTVDDAVPAGPRPTRTGVPSRDRHGRIPPFRGPAPVRNLRYVGITVGFPVVFYVLFLAQRAPGHIAGTTWKTYFMVSMASFGAMVASLNAGGTRLAAERAVGLDPATPGHPAAGVELRRRPRSPRRC